MADNAAEIVITIDGPSGVGKGTVAHRLAAALDYHYLDSGSLYRVLALAAVKHQVALDDAEALQALAINMAVSFQVDGQSTKMMTILDGEVVTESLRSEGCGQNASKVGQISIVRDALNQRQRLFRQAPGLVTDGRDMGTIVFRDAQYKFFLTASSQERAKRRCKQLKDKGLDVTLTRISQEMAQRDRRDSERAVAPLRPATDAIIIDTTEMTIDEVYHQVRGYLDEANF